MIYYALKPFNVDTTLSYGDRKYIATQVGQGVMVEYKPDSDMLIKAGLISAHKPGKAETPDDTHKENISSNTTPASCPAVDGADDEPTIEDEDAVLNAEEVEAEDEAVKSLVGQQATIVMRGRDIKVSILSVDETVAKVATVSSGREYEVDVDDLTFLAEE